MRTPLLLKPHPKHSNFRNFFRCIIFTIFSILIILWTRRNLRPLEFSVASAPSTCEEFCQSEGLPTRASTKNIECNSNRCLQTVCCYVGVVSIVQSASKCEGLSFGECFKTYSCSWEKSSCTPLLWREVEHELELIQAIGDDENRIMDAILQAIGDDENKVQMVSRALLTGAQAYSFAGGGMRAEFKWWATLWGIYTYYFKRHVNEDANVQDMFKDKVIGSNSGGGWMFNGLMYNRLMFKSFMSIAPYESSAVASFQEAARKRMNEFHEIFYGGQDKDTGWKATFERLGLTSASTYDSILRARYGGKGKLDGWKKFVQALHGSFTKVPLMPHPNIDWYSLATIVTNHIKYNQEYMYTLPDFVDKVDGYGRVIPVMLHYKFDETKNPKPIADIPIFEKMEKPIVVLQSKISEANFKWARRYEIRPSDIKTVIEQSVIDTKNPDTDSPKLFSGPSSDAPAAIATGTSWQMWMGQTEKLGGFSVRQFLWRTPPLLRAKNTNGDHIEKLPEFIKDHYPCDKELRIGLADGGPVDNAGIASTIHGLQAREQHHAKIIVFSDQWQDLPIYFEEFPEGYDWIKEQGHHPQIVKPYPKPWIFSSFKLYRTYTSEDGISFVVIHAMTRDNSHYGIKKGSLYEMVVINISPPKMQTVTSALPNGEVQENILVEGAIWIGRHLRDLSKPKSIDVVNNYDVVLVGQGKCQGVGIRRMVPLIQSFSKCADLCYFAGASTPGSTCDSFEYSERGQMCYIHESIYTEHYAVSSDQLTPNRICFNLKKSCREKGKLLTIGEVCCPPFVPKDCVHPKLPDVRFECCIEKGWIFDDFKIQPSLNRHADPSTFPEIQEMQREFRGRI